MFITYSSTLLSSEIAKVCRIVRTGIMIFNKVNIEQHPDKSISFHMHDFLRSIKPTDVPKERRTKDK